MIRTLYLLIRTLLAVLLVVFLYNERTDLVIVKLEHY
jgi:hypothetical protein